jgi:putative addiction module component (TIGR02574 family)
MQADNPLAEDDLDATDNDAAWQEEIARRLNDVESGKVTTIPWEKVRRKGRVLLQR